MGNLGHKNEVKEIAVWFSCGAASAVAAKKTVERYSDSAKIRIVNNPIAEEHPDNTRFLRDVERWIGVEIEYARNENFQNQSCVEVWNKRRFMSSPHGAPCTIELKKIARQQWEAKNPQVTHHVLGFTVDEKDRHDRFVLTERENILPVLIDAGYTKQGCLDLLLSVGIEPPAMYRLGYPNANCIGCVKASSPSYWNLVRKTHPEVFADRAKQSRDIGARLVRVAGQRVYLDELHPMSKGKPLNSLQVECGLFCEEDF